MYTPTPQEAREYLDEAGQVQRVSGWNNDRDNRIFWDYAHGIRLADISQEHGITTGRLRQIIGKRWRLLLNQTGRIRRGELERARVTGD